MTPINFPEANFTFTKPEGWTDEQCSELKVCKTTDGNQMPVIISKWQLSAEDLKEINKTQSVYLMVVGSTQPPVSLHALSPFEKVIKGCAEDLVNALKVDPELFKAYQANIAMCFYDKAKSFYSETKQVNPDHLHMIANEGAEYFLNTLINSHDGE